MADKSQKPAIVLVPGAFHTTRYLEPVVEILRSSGYSAVAVPMPSIGAKPPLPDLSQDIAAIRRASLDYLDHSSERRAEGKTTWVKAIVYVAGHVIPKGMSLVELMGGGHPPFIIQKDGYASLEGPEDRLYHDLPENERKHWASQMQPQSLGVFESKLPCDTYKQIPTSYLICTEDHFVPTPDIQEKMASDASCFLVEKVASSHSPFLSKPQETAAFIMKTAEHQK
ncbi:MAG: hypothetical protein CYPHOPRED_003801 [Cyphobasidiales sp. Tagirdzhanova-0007]|nr:MAG: hypothetical protein CYPHOPRED_003801 [Cyphobasidiales sp. Tagirdzhanova-0007]